MEAIKGIYHADKVDAETFISNFIIRLKEFSGIIDNLKKQNKKPLQHFLITGKRGMGKSTLLRRLYLEARQKPLSDKIIAVRLGSEQYKLSRLYKLWEEVIRYLELEDGTLKEKREKLSEEKNYEDHVIQIVVDYLNAQNKTLLLLIDNFDQFIDKLTAKEQHEFREALIQHPIQIIGNTVFYSDHFFKYDKPFFDFFRPIHLKNLDKKESEEFIKKLAINEGMENFGEILNTKKGKIETLRILSGGVPRTLVILLHILSKKNTGDAIDYLNEMLEQVTPLYQDRMKALSSQQQEIMHDLAIQWDRTSAKDLAKESRIPSKSISAQLSQLEDSGYINKISTSKRNHLYEIDERFFNIWLLMSEASAYDGKRVIWLTRWLDMFYDSKELEDYASYCKSSLKQAKPSNRFLIAQALSESAKLKLKFRDELVLETEKDLSLIIPEIKQWAKSYSNRRDKEVDKIYDEITESFKKKNYEHALVKLEKLKEIDESNAYFGIGLIYNYKRNYENAEKYYLMAIERGNGNAMANLGILYEDIKKDYEKAEKYYLMAVEEENIDAMFNIGFLYYEIRKDYDKAEKYYLMAIEKGNVDAMCNMGFLYYEIRKDYDKAEKYYLMAAEKGNVDSIFNIGLLNDEITKNYDKAEKFYLMAAAKEDTMAMFNLGFLYEDIKKDYEKAEKYWLMAAEKGNEMAMVNVAFLYENIKTDYDKAEQFYLMAAEKGDIKAMFNLGFFYEDIKKDYEKAEKYLLMAVERGHKASINHLAAFYFEHNNVVKKIAALNLAKGIEQDADAISLTIKTEIFLWNENIKDAYSVLEQQLEKFQNDDDANEAISNALISFLIFKQKQLLYRLFSEIRPILKDKFKPVYFALMHEMKKEFPDEYLKMTEELAEPVNDLLAFVKKERKRLNIS